MRAVLSDSVPANYSPPGFFFESLAKNFYLKNMMQKVQTYLIGMEALKYF